ncbi:hypothetical protein AM588_10007446 [Phytophthora nicotianae]|uniref:Uncharacterized protein n=1 Tax=Phytophthora nicotianae TaxID=4792 RepID=A0A0W8DDB2_PHYNI|nr:hypothetical protein AM588_10007446 [Phytophthora nicotianae]
MHDDDDKTETPSDISPSADSSPVCKKRELNESQKDSGEETQEVQKKRPKRKYRKSTINVRKEEKATLLEELAELHTKLEKIKARAFATCVGVEARTPSEMQSANRVLRRAIQKQQLECTKIHALMSEYSLFEEIARLEMEIEALKAQIVDMRSGKIGPFDENEEILKRKYEAGRVLRESVQQRQQIFSQLSSIMSEYTLCTIQSGSPLQDFIHLKTDEQTRRDILAAIKIKKMEKAQRFMEMRRPKLDPCNVMGEERRYEAGNGDFCSTRFTVTQFKDAKSVKEVFDLLLYYFCNIEISISEKIGHITIREDDGGDDGGIVQNRLVSTTHKNVKMESNTVMFSQYYDRSTQKSIGSVDKSYGIIVADFVDEDDRHPYVPSQRVRRDVNAVLEIREFMPKHQAGKPVVVLSRWVQNRMHYPKFLVLVKKLKHYFVGRDGEAFEGDGDLTERDDGAQETSDRFDYPVDRLVRNSRRQMMEEGVQEHMNVLQGSANHVGLHANIQAGTPLQEKIILKKDSKSRHENSASNEIQEAQGRGGIFEIRRSELDPLKDLTEDRRYETDSRAFCSVRFSIIQFEGIESVKQIFDMVVFYFSNMEISVSEKLETLITVRENDDDSTIEGITQNFLMSTTTGKFVRMESNIIMFSEFYERDDIQCSDCGYGIVVSEFVGVDESYPYRPKERVRKDVNGVIEVRGYDRP